MPDIKLFVCCHRLEQVPKHPLLYPIQVGAALTDIRFPGFLYDDSGDNISEKNHSYCELTAQYWAWKNVEADYYGFFHYRRYLYPDVGSKFPYRVEWENSLSLLNRLGYKGFAQLIQKYDLIVPQGENMYVPVWEHYANAPYHHLKDLKLVEQIVKKQYPEMSDALEEHLSGTICYFGNIYIMHHDVFYDYCTWLFSILKEFDQRADTRNYDARERRVDGYLAERLLGGYLVFRQSKLRTLELPRVHFYTKTEYLKYRILNKLLPPGSRQRSTAKAIFAGGLQLSSCAVPQKQKKGENSKE